MPGDLHLPDATAADGVELADHLRRLGHDDASRLGFCNQIGKLGCKRLVHVAVDGDLPLVEHALGKVYVKPQRTAGIAHVVVVPMDEIVTVQLVHFLHLVLRCGELPFDVLHLVDPLQHLVFHVVPKLHPFAVGRRIMARLAAAEKPFGELRVVARVEVDAVHKAPEVVAVVAMARYALVDVAVRS